MPEPSATGNSIPMSSAGGRLRLTVAARLMLVLGAMATLSTGLALTLHDRSLASDLEGAAQERLARASGAANQLVEDHLGAVRERYRAISGTPQLRANLEVDHTPTLGYYASTLQRTTGASLLAFLARGDRVIAAVGDPSLLEATRDVPDAALVAHGDTVYAVTSAELRTSAGRVGRMLAAEPIDARSLQRWSELCGADLAILQRGAAEAGSLARTVRSLGALDLVVRSNLDAEHEALRRSRFNLVTAGTLALALSLIGSFALARGFVRPILAIQTATERIRGGDLEVRLGSQRRDEIGDVARAFDLMLGGLRESRRLVDAHLANLRRSEGHLANAQRMARLGSFELVLEKGGHVELHGSEQFRSLYQLPAGDDPLDPERVRRTIHPDDLLELEETLRATISQTTSFSGDFRVQLPNGSERIMHAEALPKLDAKGRVSRIEGTVQDVTERHRADEQIRFLAYHDGLTGLGNRKLFADRLDLALAQARRRNAAIGVLFVDLDRFKRINETLGHGVGDELLRRAADRILAVLRENDLAGHAEKRDADFVSRLGGDQFGVLLRDVRQPRDFALVAQRLLAALEQPFELADHEVVVGASVGIATWPGDGDDVDALLRNAGSAMDHAKERGRNQFEFYAESMNREASERLRLEARMRRALRDGHFELHYQPSVEIATGRVAGFEALMRWRDPQTGLQPPGAFIPVAEQSGMILQLGSFALTEACRRLAIWQDEIAADIQVSVNLSPQQFLTHDLVDRVSELLEETGIRPEGLEVEITESTVMGDEKRVVAVLEQLRGLGLAVALDDFGTGQSSLSYLRQLPVDTLKIDMSFVHTIAENEQDARLTAAIVGLGQARGLRVVAEGVETEAQRDLLASWGCDRIQGFLISPALPADAAAELATRCWLPG